MDAQQFAYWLQGFAELNETPPTTEQWQSIRQHLATVFVKVTPNYQSGRSLLGVEMQRSECATTIC